MAETKKYLDQEGVAHLWSKINMQDYPNNELLIGVIEAIDETKANKEDVALIKTEVNTKINDLSDVVAYIDPEDNENIEESVTGSGVSSWNDLKDKPFYSEIIELLPSTVATQDVEIGSFDVAVDFTFVPGNTYIITRNGVEHTLVAEKITAEGETMTLIGNISIAGIGLNNGLPFLMFVDDGTFVYVDTEETEPTISIKEVKVIPIEQSYVANAFPYWIDVIDKDDENSSDTNDRLYTTNATVAEVEAAIKSGRDVKLRVAVMESGASIQTRFYALTMSILDAELYSAHGLLYNELSFVNGGINPSGERFLFLHPQEDGTYIVDETFYSD